MATTATSLSAKDLDTVFEDVVPLPQSDGPNAVAVIDYPPHFEQAYDYFRAILASNERSARALQLTALCLSLNPANYTVWQFRRSCLEALASEDGEDSNENTLKEQILADFQLAAKLGGSNPKNFQIWYHRRALLQRLESKPVLLMELCNAELEYLKTVLQKDGKNYHAWSHRQWVVRTLNTEEIFQQEVAYSEELIDEDIRNNSAWNQRWYAVHRAGKVKALGLEEAKEEADYAVAQAKIDPYNESPWRYLVGILKEQKKMKKEDPEKWMALLSEYEIKSWMARETLLEAGRDPDTCPNLLSAIVDILEWKGDKDSIERAMELTRSLQKHDAIRAKYWQFRESGMAESP